LYAFFWVIPRRLKFICRRFGTLCSIFIGKLLCETGCGGYGSLPSTTCLCTLTHPYPVTHPPSGSAIFEPNLSRMIAQHFSILVHSPHNYEDGTECSKTSAYKLQTLENYPEESIQHSYFLSNVFGSTDSLLRQCVAQAPSSLMCLP
jgi:hypothetical protein